MSIETKPRTGETMHKGPARNRELARRNAAIYNLYVFGVRGKRLSQVEIAEKFGITQGSVSQIINNDESHLYVP